MKIQPGVNMGKEEKKNEDEIKSRKKEEKEKKKSLSFHRSIWMDLLTLRILRSGPTEGQKPDNGRAKIYLWFPRDTTTKVVNTFFLPYFEIHSEGSIIFAIPT